MNLREQRIIMSRYFQKSDKKLILRKTELTIYKENCRCLKLNEIKSDLRFQPSEKKLTLKRNTDLVLHLQILMLQSEQNSCKLKKLKRNDDLLKLSLTQCMMFGDEDLMKSFHKHSPKWILLKTLNRFLQSRI